MQSKEKCYYVTVKKSADITYRVYAFSFEQALSLWDQEGDEFDVVPNDPVVLGVMVKEES